MSSDTAVAEPSSDQAGAIDDDDPIDHYKEQQQRPLSLRSIESLAEAPSASIAVGEVMRSEGGPDRLRCLIWRRMQEDVVVQWTQSFERRSISPDKYQGTG